MTLTDFESDVRTIADVEAFGVVLGRPGGRAQLMTRHRVGASAHLVPVDRLAAPFLPTVGTVTLLAPLAAHVDISHPVFDRLSRYTIDSLLVVPLPDGAGMLWTGTREGHPFSGDQVTAFERLAERIGTAIHQPESRESRIDRQSRVDAVEQILPLVASALDVRDTFHRLSDVARSVLPHDAATIQILSDDRTQARLYALNGLPQGTGAEPFSTNYAPVFNEHFQYSLHDDLQASATERDRPTAKAGLRSALRMPLRFDGRTGGALEFSAAVIDAFHETDVPVAERIAEYVSLAIAHQRMADSARRAAELRARSQNLIALDELLATLSGVLDVREVFDRVSTIAQQVLPHDGLVVIVPTGEGDRSQNYAISGLGDVPRTIEGRVREPALLTEPWEFRIFDDLAAHPAYEGTLAVIAGMRGALLLPIRLAGRLHAFLSFLSRERSRFTQDDVLVGRRIADHVALALSHQRLAEQARKSTELQAQAANLELLDDLLAALTDAAPLSEMFDRISVIAKKVIPHDAILLPVRLPDGIHARAYASSGVAAGLVPEVIPIPPAFLAPDWEYEIVDDAAVDPAAHNQRMAANGFRSGLRVPIRIDGTFAAGLAFSAREPGVYTPGDVLAARRMADRLALCLRRELQANASKRAEEASARAAELEARVRALTEELDARSGYKRVVGQSASWKHALTQAMQVASTDTTVLLLGESGTGKEVVARFLHRASARANGPFIALNCAALPEQLLEAELFGYERGAYTGATQSKPGQLEQAAGGTLFLDEVGEMALPAQAKFLRVLQEREFQRLGGTRVLRTDARIVAATNRDLPKAIAGAQFREDLFYRLNVFAIRLPALRDRRDDILPLSESFIADIGRGLGRPPAGIAKDARARLMDYDWPGNVRELRNILERAAILCDGGLITAEHLALNPAPRSTKPTTGRVVAPAPEPVPEPVAAPAAPTGDIAAMERAMIEQALQNARFNKSKAAAALGLTRAQLYVRMRKYGLE
jgi:transcriptional regulator with GAF, ATPase, and Fis domain